jgi:hypothetical protein
VDTSAALKESAEQDLARPGPEAAAADDQEA